MQQLSTKYDVNHALKRASGGRGGGGRRNRQARAMKEKAHQEIHKDAETDHGKRENCSLDFGGATVIHTEDNKHRRWIREAIDNGGDGGGAGARSPRALLSHLEQHRGSAWSRLHNIS